MKLMKLTSLLVVALVLTSGVTGCKKKIHGPTPLPSPRTGSGGDSATERTGTYDPGSQGQNEPKPMSSEFGDLSNYNLDRATLAANTVHFTYDSAAIRASEQPHVEAVASYLKSSNAALLVEGHCDERGTEEYNRALGERRALKLREELIKLGCDSQKIVTKSYGKDRRIDTTESESGHAKNRRGEFVVLTPK